MAFTWKVTLGMQKPIGSLNGALCAYKMRLNHNNRPRPKPLDNKGIKVFATFEDDPRKIAHLRALTVTSNARSWKTRTNFAIFRLR